MQSFKSVSKLVKDGTTSHLIEVDDKTEADNPHRGILFMVLENTEVKEPGSSRVVASRQMNDGSVDWRETTLVGALARAIRLQGKVDISMLPKLKVKEATEKEG